MLVWSQHEAARVAAHRGPRAEPSPRWADRKILYRAAPSVSPSLHPSPPLCSVLSIRAGSAIHGNVLPAVCASGLPESIYT